MNRTTQFLATAFIAGLGAFTTGCTDAETSVFIRHVVVPTVDDGGCLYDADPDGAAFLEGYFDAGLLDSYSAVLAVGNQLVQRGDDETLKPESNRVQFYEVEVEVFDFQGALMSAFTVPATGFADPGTGGTPGYGPVGAVLVDSTVVAAFRSGAQPAGQTIVSRVIVKGVSLGGAEVQTAPWDFPITVNASDPGSGNVACQQAECEADEAAFCFLGQDVKPDCRAVDRAFGSNLTDCPP